jgi:drug/metabolite transporter (DMT)-like permease
MRTPIEMLSLMYFVAYVPYVVLTRWLATVTFAPFGRALTGLEVLPAATLLSGVVTFAFVWAAGWYRDAHQVRILGSTWPAPTRWTVLSGIGTALLLFTVPLSFTFKGVSIPFMQLMMRGDVLLIAPLVDLLFGRRVRFFSWIALVLVAAGLMLTIRARGGLYLPPLAIVTVVLYTLGYFVRLAVMTKTAKRDDARSTKGYFVEEKMVAIPVAVLALAFISISGIGAQKGELAFGFIGVWNSGQLGYISLVAVLLVALSIFAVLILLDKRENTFCVPLERSASILAGIAAAFILALGHMGPPPTGAEMAGAALLILAIVLLSLGPRLWPAPVRT